MTILHSFVGLIAGAALFAMFWMGSLSLFDHEIDRWMQPHTRLAAPARPAALDAALVPELDRLAPTVDRFLVTLPDAREPTLQLGYSEPGGIWRVRHFDPASGAELHGPDSLAGTGFIFPFHFSFHIEWQNLGLWLAGFLAMAMLVLLVSGLVVHRKIIAEFFVLRPDKHRRRLTLDLHNLTSIAALPFHVLLPLSGLFIFFGVYFPWSAGLPFGGELDRVYAEMRGQTVVAAAGTPAPMASLDAMLAEAERRWAARDGAGPARATLVMIEHWGDTSARVAVREVFPGRSFVIDRQSLTFAAARGAVIGDHIAGPVRHVHAWFAGLHFAQWDHWPLRWLYFAGGLAGCAMIATGLVFWLESRRRPLHRPGADWRAVQAMTIGGTTGIIAATALFLLVNRLLPEGAAWGGTGRAALEVWAFFLGWGASFVHAAARGPQACAEQCRIIAALAGAAVLANALTTAEPLPIAAARGLWAVAGVDLALLAGAAGALLAARRLGAARRAAAAPAPATYAEAPAE
jgi:uncharacterized iron-regulated membrane protein